MALGMYICNHSSEMRRLCSLKLSRKKIYHEHFLIFHEAKGLLSPYLGIFNDFKELVIFFSSKLKFLQVCLGTYKYFPSMMTIFLCVQNTFNFPFHFSDDQKFRTGIFLVDGVIQWRRKFNLQKSGKVQLFRI